MAQITIYMDDETIKKIETAAHKEHDSVSRWIKKRLVGVLESNWPKGYFDLFGAMDDGSFRRPAQPAWSKDRKRQTL